MLYTSLCTGVSNIIFPFVEKRVISSNITIIYKRSCFGEEIRLSNWLEALVRGFSRLDATLTAAEQIGKARCLMTTACASTFLSYWFAVVHHC